LQADADRQAGILSALPRVGGYLLILIAVIGVIFVLDRLNLMREDDLELVLYCLIGGALAYLEIRHQRSRARARSQRRRAMGIPEDLEERARDRG
jgi:hypothetical protein